MNVKVNENNVGNIELNKLVISPENVRVVRPEKERDKELIASIKAKGIIQNLVVVEQDKGGKFEVVAGGRRLAALQYLNKNTDIRGSYLVPCFLHDGSDITAISLAENLKASMHPADEFMAYQKMVSAGKTLKVVAGEFGVTQNHVKGRLKLASISPVLVNYYRDGDLTLDQIMAFTVSDDHEKQMACYKELSPHYLYSTKIKSMLLGEAMRDSHGMVKLVTLKAYRKAGGATSSDLFESMTYITDRELLEEMATKLLETKRDELLSDGWKWGSVSLDHNGTNHYSGTLSAELSGVPKKLTNSLKAKNAEMEVLEDKDCADWTDADDKRQDELWDEIESLELEQSEYRAFTEEQKSVSGLVVTFDHTGRITVDFGLVKKEDMKAAFPPAKSNQSIEGEDVAFEEPIESNALQSDLSNFHLQALQSELMKSDDLAYDLLVFTLARRVLGEMDWSDRALDINANTINLSNTAGIEETGCADLINDHQTSLDLSWLGFEEENDKFESFSSLSRSQKKKHMAYCVALSLTSATDGTLCQRVRESLSFNMADHWKPTNDNYFSRINKNNLLEIGNAQMGDQFGVDNANLSRGQLAELLESRDEMLGWMPSSLS